MGLIVLTNDDGFDALGIQALYEGLKADNRLFVVAPRQQQSGASHSLTLRRPIRVERLRENFFAIEGTPTDCVLLAYHDLVHEEIDMVLSGINHGPNMGSDVFYSGTVAAALQAATLGIRAIAFSLAADKFELRAFRHAVEYARGLVGRVRAGGTLPLVLNVNVPAGRIKGEKMTKMGHRIYRDKVIRDREENGVMYSVIDGVLSYRSDADSDFKAVEEGCVSVTPLQLDLTDFGAMNAMRRQLRIE